MVSAESPSSPSHHRYLINNNFGVTNRMRMRMRRRMNNFGITNFGHVVACGVTYSFSASAPAPGLQIRTVLGEDHREGGWLFWDPNVLKGFRHSNMDNNMDWKALNKDTVIKMSRFNTPSTLH